MSEVKCLSDILRGLDKQSVNFVNDPVIHGVTSDSRQIDPGKIFVALAGEHVDGHRFVEAAFLSGASAIIVKEGYEPPDSQKGLKLIEVEDTRLALANIAATLYGPLPSPMVERIVGLTGTNGKTTVSYLVESILLAAKRLPGILGTINYRVGSRIFPAVHTTPPPELLWQTIGHLLKEGATDLVMEVSSHALHQSRVDGLGFTVAGFTNLTQDHLDYHKDFQDYLAQKSRLFGELLSPNGRAILNADDASFPTLLSLSRAPVWSYSLDSNSDADIKVLEQEIGIKGTKVEVQTPKGLLSIESSLIGSFNVSNLLLACGVALALDIPKEFIEKGIHELPAVPGRMESIPHSLPFQVVVDYAHTPDALRNVLQTLRVLCRKRLIVLFGCGGDRDQGKRQLMGVAAAQIADIVIVTSDNPRNEDPEQIIEQILPGVTSERSLLEQSFHSEKRGYWVCVDRRKAIQKAIEIAEQDDLILIAGKGHESYQIVGERQYPFDDRVISASALFARDPNCIAKDYYQSSFDDDSRCQPRKGEEA